MDDIKTLVSRSHDTWNAHDRDGWLACFNDDVEFQGPGGLAGQGSDAGRMFWSIWQDAFPDCQVTMKVAVAEGDNAIQDAVFSGTHTEGSPHAQQRRHSADGEKRGDSLHARPHLS